MLLGDAPISGNFFFPSFEALTVEQQVQALSGDIRQEATDSPLDHRYIHALGPITLKRGKGAEIWIAIVAGEDEQELLDNARAAGRRD